MEQTLATAFAGQVYKAFQDARFEPVRRRHDGTSAVNGHIGHRFPIKGGLRLSHLMTESLLRETQLLKALANKP